MTTQKSITSNGGTKHTFYRIYALSVYVCVYYVLCMHVLFFPRARPHWRDRLVDADTGSGAAARCPNCPRAIGNTVSACQRQLKRL